MRTKPITENLDRRRAGTGGDWKGKGGGAAVAPPDEVEPGFPNRVGGGGVTWVPGVFVEYPDGVWAAVTGTNSGSTGFAITGESVGAVAVVKPGRTAEADSSPRTTRRSASENSTAEGKSSAIPRRSIAFPVSERPATGLTRPKDSAVFRGPPSNS